MTSVKYPKIEVPLVGYDGNAFAILGRVSAAMRLHGLDDEQIDEFITQAQRGTYDQLLCTVMEYVTVPELATGAAFHIYES